MNRRPLHHPLKTRGRLRIARPVSGETGQILVEKLGQVVAQLIKIDPAGAQHRRGIGVLDQPEQQVFEGRVFVLAFAGEPKGTVERLFEVPGEHDPTLLHSSR